MQKSVVKDTKEERIIVSINLTKAQEKLQEEDRFEQEEDRKKVKAYGEMTSKKVSQRRCQQEAGKDQRWRGAFQGWSGDDGEICSTHFWILKESDSEDMKNGISDAEKKQRMRKGTTVKRNK